VTPAEDVPIRDASTVVLLRDGADGIEAWLINRVSGMVFAAGMSVFPGGRVDEADADLPFGDAALTDLAQRFGADERSAAALVGAAVRETFEETGVLLTVPGADLSGARADVERGLVSFGDLLRANAQSIDASVLHPWARWITPPGEKRRYDTRFFLAALPDGATAQDVTTESETAGWVPLQASMDQVQRAERRMLPPTVATIASLLPFANVADAIASSTGRSTDPVQPRIRAEGEHVIAELDDGTTYTLPLSMFR
jgi:8-oxo-dGTP pyrophosphatase MutT (NUDIX family)